MKTPDTYYNELSNLKAEIESYLDCAVNDIGGIVCSPLANAMRYSLMAGGKRIRPILTLLFYRASGGADDNLVMPVACALEYVHTYSLIHDDLPCMDNDTIRRGKPTNHVIYGEGNATLAGDALLADAFTLILNSGLAPEIKANCALELSLAAGSRGICAGQYFDLNPGICDSDKELALTKTNNLKTGAMFIAACCMGVIAAGGTKEQVEQAELYGAAIGQAFQVRDDLLDAISNTEDLGKTIGKDAESGKVTYYSLFGEEHCVNFIHELTATAIDALSVFDNAQLLAELASQLAERKN